MVGLELRLFEQLATAGVTEEAITLRRQVALSLNHLVVRESMDNDAASEVLVLIEERRHRRDVEAEHLADVGGARAAMLRGLRGQRLGPFPGAIAEQPIWGAERVVQGEVIRGICEDCADSATVVVLIAAARDRAQYSGHDE